MSEALIKDLATKTELGHAEWLFFSKFQAEADNLQRKTLIKALAAHSGVPINHLATALQILSEPQKAAVHEHVLNDLQQFQRDSSLKINTFKEHSYFKSIDLEVLAITRANWLAIIEQFERQGRHNVTSVFFLHALSAVKREPLKEIRHKITKPQPGRGVKRSYQEHSAAALPSYSYIEDNGVNPLILQSDEDNPNLDLESRIALTGARSVPLNPATPEKGYTNVAKTPGGTKARELCTIGRYRLFKPISPFGKQNRDKIAEKTKEEMNKALPRVLFKRAQPVEYVATLATINERSGEIRRQSSRSLMGASASEVFRAHGIEITAVDGKKEHWAHLIAHFIGDSQNLITADPNSEVLNLVPSTAAANYNTLEAVELFLRKKLLKKETEEIRIHVNPIYNDEALIPETLVYSLNWVENKMPRTETFYINPQSYYRITKSMHQSIAVLRAEANVYESPQDEAMDEDGKNDTSSPRI